MDRAQPVSPINPQCSVNALGEEASVADGGGGIDRDHPSLVADADPEAGLAPTQGPSDHGANDHDNNDNKATTKSGTASSRASSWRQLAAAARSHLLLDTSDKEAGGWTGPHGERRSEEQVYRAQLCLIDAGEKQRPTLARGPPGKEAAPMRWYHLR